MTMQEIESNASPNALMTGRTSIVEAVKLEPRSEEPVRIPLPPSQPRQNWQRHCSASKASH